MNWWLSDEHTGSSWRLQELPDTDLHLSGGDSPIFGRSFAIFYNQVRLGRLEVTDAYGYSASEPKVRMNIELNDVRLMSFDRVRDFLLHVAIHVCNADDSLEYVRAQQAIEQAMTRAVWNALHISGFNDLDGQSWDELEVCLEGTAVWYFGRRDCETFRQLKAAA